MIICLMNYAKIIIKNSHKYYYLNINFKINQYIFVFQKTFIKTALNLKLNQDSYDFHRLHKT